MKGKVKWFDEKKGYGFIIQADGGKEVFVHYSAIDGTGFKTLKESEEVEFEAEETGKGLRATSVVRA